MVVANRFEELLAWQKARELTAAVYRQTRGCRDFDLARQMQRAAVSVMANIAEGFERSRPREFHQLLSVAKASCAELRSHLYVAMDSGLLNPTDFVSLQATAEEVARVVGGLRSSIARRHHFNSALSTQHSALP